MLFTGLGGQGIQIASRTLATAAIDEGRQVMLVPRYGGGMRGGMTNAELTVSDGPLRALPVATAAWSAFVMDSSYWHTVRSRLAHHPVVLVNASLVTGTLDLAGATVWEVPASSLAVEVASPMSAVFVLLGAFAAVTGLVGTEAVVAAMRELVPDYRTQHLEANERAIRAGAEALPALGSPAWTVPAA